MPETIVAILWHDASQHPGYHSHDEAQAVLDGEGALMTSVGLFVAEDERYVVIAMSRNTYRWGDLLRIPVECIKQRRVVAEEFALAA